jgi:ABC-type transporter Mla maintaining outer membrane lipid asymmetry permease subunit MlaE
MSEQRTFRWRDLLGAVNLRDFAQMVGSEAAQIGTSLRLAFQALPRLPMGPLLFLLGVLMALFRSLLLLLVVVVFGGAILIISAVRGLTRRGARES